MIFKVSEAKEVNLYLVLDSQTICHYIAYILAGIVFTDLQGCMTVLSVLAIINTIIEKNNVYS